MAKRRFIFSHDASEQYNEWAMQHRPTFKRLVDVLKDVSRSPFDGIGKPELLKHQYAGFWSRRITDEHRLIYKVNDVGDIEIASCYGHYP